MISLKIQRWVPITWIETTNKNINRKTVEEIKMNFDADLFGALPGIFTPYGTFRITDGNHRFTAFKEMRRKYVPIIMLSDEEYTHIAYSKNEVEFCVKRTMQVFETFPDCAVTKLTHL